MSATSSASSAGALSCLLSFSSLPAPSSLISAVAAFRVLLLVEVISMSSVTGAIKQRGWLSGLLVPAGTRLLLPVDSYIASGGGGGGHYQRHCDAAAKPASYR